MIFFLFLFSFFGYHGWMIVQDIYRKEGWSPIITGTTAAYFFMLLVVIVMYYRFFRALWKSRQKTQSLELPSPHRYSMPILIASVVALIVSLVLVVSEQTKLIPLEEKVVLAENDLQLFQKIVDADQERLAPLKGYDPTDPRRLVAEAKLKTDLVFHREKEKAEEEAQNVLDAAKEASSRWKVVVGWALGYCAVILGLLAFVSAWNQLKRLEFMPEKNGLIRSAIVLYTGIPVTLLLIGFAIYITVIAKGVLS